MDEARQRAASWGVPYVETSAKTRHNVDEVFLNLMDQIKTQKLKSGHQPTHKKKSNVKKSKCTIL